MVLVEGVAVFGPFVQRIDIDLGAGRMHPVNLDRVTGFHAAERAVIVTGTVLQLCLRQTVGLIALEAAILAVIRKDGKPGPLCSALACVWMLHKFMLLAGGASVKIRWFDPAVIRVRWISFDYRVLGYSGRPDSK